MKVGRNDPCPCGSGRKYKHCHLRTEEGGAPDEILWRQLNLISQSLSTDLLRFATRTFGPDIVHEAWEVFTAFEETEFDPESIHLPIFMPWFFHDWLPDPDETIVPEADVETFPLSLAYLSKNRVKDPLTRRYIEASVAAGIGYFDVIESTPGSGLTLRDCLTGTQTAVVERTASQTLRRGDILFARVVTVDGLATIDGCAPVVFPPLEKAAIIELRREILEEEGEVTAAILKDYDIEMLEIYREVSGRLLNPRQPELTNTDGDPLVLCRVAYQITTPRAAFDALLPLAVDHAEAELLEGATFDAAGDLLTAEIPWVSEGESMVIGRPVSLGTITIEPGSLVAEVNSEARAARFRELADTMLPDGCRHVSTVLEPIDAALAAHRREEPADDEVDINDLPEVQAMITEQLRAHYRAWPEMEIPALSGLTPLQAIRTPEGREMVEALLLDIEQRSAAQSGMRPEIVAELRQTLNLT